MTGQTLLSEEEDDNFDFGAGFLCVENSQGQKVSTVHTKA